jgi:uncharacterized repeat protein (TIGR01451 family)
MRIPCLHPERRKRPEGGYLHLVATDSAVKDWENHLTEKETKMNKTRMHKARIIISMMFTLLLLPTAVRAQQQSIELKSVAEVEVVTTNAQGSKEVNRIDASKSKVVPGDIVIFTTTYTNVGKKPAEQVVITNPVPEHMNYVDLSAEGKGTKIDFSVDKGKNYGDPDKLTLTDAQGMKRKAGPADYTDIRWTLIKPLPTGGTGSVSFRAKLQ